MKKELQLVIPKLFEDNLLVLLSKDWISVFGKIPTFSVKISKKKLVLESIELVTEKKK